MVETWIDRQEAEEAAKFREPFDAVKFPKRFWEDNSVIRYKVYSDAENFVIVTAQTAAKALDDSGIEKAHKIERYILEYELEVDDVQLTEEIHMYERPILDTITENNPVVSSKILNGVMQAADALLADNKQRDLQKQVESASGEAPVAAAQPVAPAAGTSDQAAAQAVFEPAIPPQTPNAQQPQEDAAEAPEDEDDSVSFDDAIQAPSLKNIISDDSEASVPPSEPPAEPQA